MGTKIRVEEPSAILDGLPEAVERLVKHLSPSASAPSAAQLEEMIDSPAGHLLIARNPDGTIIGTLTLAMFRIPTGLRAWIEDVVVDEAARRQGVGEALTRAALALAAEHGTGEGPNR